MNHLNNIRIQRENNRLSHAYLFYGEKNTNVFDFAFEALKIIISNEEQTFEKPEINSFEDLNYLDLVFLEPENNLISKEKIKQAMEKLQETAFNKNNKKVFFIKNIEKASIPSLNSFLKFLEEPPKNTIIILTTNQFDLVIKTIISRTQNIFIKESLKKNLTKELLANKKTKGIESLLSSIFLTEEEISLNLDNFRKDYDLLMNSFKNKKINSSLIRITLHIIVTKKNWENIINIFSRLIYTSTFKLENRKAFINENDIIESFKKSIKEPSKIIVLIDEFKNNVANHNNFALQKEKLLINIESYFNE